MHDFTFNGQSLLSLGGRIVQPPVHTVARRSTERVKLYGRSGDEIIDNESYDNADFSLKIALLPHLTQRTAHDLAYAVIDWLAPLQNGYYVYTDTCNPGYFTKAVLTNIDEIRRDLRTLLTATLKFSREPYWYSDAGASEVAAVNKIITLTNPELYSAEPVLKLTYTGSADYNAYFSIYVSDTTTPSSTEFARIALGGITPNHWFDSVRKQHYSVIDGQKVYRDGLLISDILPGGSKSFKFSLYGTSQISVSDVTMTVTPNWRRL